MDTKVVLVGLVAYVIGMIVGQLQMYLHSKKREPTADDHIAELIKGGQLTQEQVARIGIAVQINGPIDKEPIGMPDDDVDEGVK
jgi:hypothetical protein